MRQNITHNTYKKIKQRLTKGDQVTKTQLRTELHTDMKSIEHALNELKNENIITQKDNKYQTK